MSPCSVGDMCDEDMDDMDGDEVPNDEDNCPKKPNPDQLDQDGDGVGDICDNCPLNKNPDQTDDNQNFIGDICEQGEDEDGDGFVGKMATHLSKYPAELSHVVGSADNCPQIPNYDQQDIDNDSERQTKVLLRSHHFSSEIGDLCDDDIDGDGIRNTEDNCPLVANKNQEKSETSVVRKSLEIEFEKPEVAQKLKKPQFMS